MPKVTKTSSHHPIWETDRSEPTAPNLVKLADFFDVSIDLEKIIDLYKRVCFKRTLL